MAALDRLPPVPMDAFRQFVAGHGEILKRYQPGSIVTEKAFTFASKTLAGTLPGNALFIYRPNPNGHGRNISLYSHLPLEEKFLFKPGSKFRVLSVEQKAAEIFNNLQEVG